MERRERKSAKKDPKVEAPKESASIGAVKDDKSEVASPRAVCVALPHAGKPVRVLGNNVSEFISTLQNSTLAWVNFAVDDLEKEGPEIAVRLGFSDSLIPTVMKGYYAAFEDRNTEMAIMVPAVRIQKLDIQAFPLIILVRKDLILTIHGCDVERLVLFSRYADSYMRKFPTEMSQSDKLTLLLVRILDENDTYNFEHLRDIEEQADLMSEMLLDQNVKRMDIGKRIYEMKHALITYLNTLWRTLDVLHSLRYGDAALISDNPKTLAQMGLLAEDVNRQIALSEHMSEVLASGLEVLQTLYNNQLQILNNRMALTMTWLTILGTAVLVPNTLATIAGSFGGMSRDNLIFYIALLVWSTGISTAMAYWWVRRKVQLPSSPQ